MDTRPSNKRRLTRRHVLKTGAAALGAGTSLLNGPSVLDAQTTQAPAVLTGTQTGLQNGEWIEKSDQRIDDNTPQLSLVADSKS